MDFPDQKALRGFRSKAQSRWAHATDQWWADEYERHTNYMGIPDRVNEDLQEGIGDWGNPINEDHPVISLWEKAIEDLKNAKTVEEFEKASSAMFKVGRVWNQDDNLKDRKIVQSFVGQYRLMIDILEKWKSQANDQIKPEIKDMWEKFIERHGNPEDDVWEPMSRANKVRKTQTDSEAYTMGRRAGEEVSPEVSEWINFELSSKTDMHPAFIKGLVKGTIFNQKADANADTAAINENAVVRKAVRHTGFDKKMMEKFWQDSITEEKMNYTEEKRTKKFWSAVVERFKSKIRNIDILEAKRVMDERKALRKSIDNFVTHLAKGDYDTAQTVIPEMIKNQLGTMINRKKEAYLRDLGNQVKEKAKKV